METKTCTQCKEERPLDYFYKNGKFYRSRCKPCLCQNTKEYYSENCEAILDKSKTYYKANRQDVIDRTRKYKTENKEKYKAIASRYMRTRYANDPAFRLKALIRSQIKRALDGRTKSSRTFELLGYSNETLQEHLLGDMQMFIDNEVPFHIDHKIPLEWFLEDTPIKISFDLRNLQIISEEENNAKKHFYPSITDRQYLEEIRPYIKDEYIAW